MQFRHEKIALKSPSGHSSRCIMVSISFPSKEINVTFIDAYPRSSSRPSAAILSEAGTSMLQSKEKIIAIS